MTRDLTDLSSNNKSDKNRRKFHKDLRSGKVEKTFEVVTEKEFVQKDQWSSAEEPMPDITLRDLEKINRRKKKAEKEQQRIAAEERENAIRMTASKDKEQESESEEDDISEGENRITLEKSEAAEKKEKKQRKGKEKKSGGEKEDGRNTVTDIRAARKKEKTKKRIKNAAVLLIIAAFAGTTYVLRDKWVPKLEGILDNPHETIVNDGETEKGNFPLTFDEGAVSSISHIDNFLLSLDKNHLQIYNEAGEEENSFNHNYADPVLKTAKKRMMIYDNGGTSFTVLNRKNEMYSKTVDSKILLADIANNNYAAVVTEDEKYAGILTVYDENGTVVYKWSSNARILSFSFSADGSGCYVSTFSASGGELKSVVRYMRFNSTEEIMKSEPITTLALDVMENDNGDFWVVGDDCFVKLDGEGNIIMQYEYNSAIVGYDLSAECAAVVFDGIKRESTELMIFDSNSDKDEPDEEIYTDDGKPKSLYIEGGKIILLKDKIVECYDFSGNLLATADISAEYTDFTYFNDSVYLLDYREINKISFST